MSQAVRESERSPSESSRTKNEVRRAVEAVLLHADKAVPGAKLAQSVGLVPESTEEGAAALNAAKAELEKAIEALNGEYEATGRAFRIEAVAGGYRLMTLPDFAGVIAAFKQQRSQNRLSKPAVETLAIIAYRQPITRAEIEAIRGVACGEVLKTLLDHRLITIQGRAEEIGRPMLYGTTRQFLDTFGLANLKDLPQVAELGDRQP